MNDMELLERLSEDVKADPAALERVRERFLREASKSRPAHGRPVRGLLVAAAAAVAIAGAVLVVPAIRGGGGADAAAAQVLDRAARHESATEVGKDEWLHVRSYTIRQEGSVLERQVQETWVPGDPALDTRFRDFQGLVYQRSAGLPEIATDPDATVDDIYAWLMRDSGDLQGADAAFERAGETLADHSAPADFKARLFEAIKRIDGVHIVSASTDFAGYDAVLLGRDDGGYDTQLAFGRADGAFIGYQGLAVDGGETPGYRTLLTSRVVQALPHRATTCIALGSDETGWYPPPGCTLHD